MEERVKTFRFCTDDGKKMLPFYMEERKKTLLFYM